MADPPTGLRRAIAELGSLAWTQQSKPEVELFATRITRGCKSVQEAVREIARAIRHLSGPASPALSERPTTIHDAVFAVPPRRFGDSDDVAAAAAAALMALGIRVRLVFHMDPPRVYVLARVSDGEWLKVDPLGEVEPGTSHREHEMRPVATGGPFDVD